MRYTLIVVEERGGGGKELWVHLLNEKRCAHHVIVSFMIRDLRSDEKIFENYARVSITTIDFVIRQLGDEIREGFRMKCFSRRKALDYA